MPNSPQQQQFDTYEFVSRLAIAETKVSELKVDCEVMMTQIDKLQHDVAILLREYRIMLLTTGAVLGGFITKLVDKLF